MLATTAAICAAVCVAVSTHTPTTVPSTNGKNASIEQMAMRNAGKVFPKKSIAAKRLLQKLGKKV